MKIFSYNMRKAFSNAVRLLVCGALAGGMAGVADVASAETYISGATVKPYDSGFMAWIGNAGTDVVVDSSGTEPYGTTVNTLGVYSTDSDVSGGNVIVRNFDGSNIAVRGGRSKNNSATGNSVTVEGGSNIAGVYGGHAAKDASGNTVFILGGTITGGVIGGRSNSGVAEGNTLTITGGSFTSTVTGGYSTSGTAKGNTVNLVGIGGKMGNIGHTGDAPISISNNYVAAGYSPSGTVVNNVMNIYGQGTQVLKLVNWQVLWSLFHLQL